MQKTSEVLQGVFGAKTHTEAVETEVDAVILLPPHRFLIEFKNGVSKKALDRAIDRLTRAEQSGAIHDIPLLVVPFMNEPGKLRCEQAGISWLDLSGNATIRHGSLFVRIEGNPNKYKTRGRPRNPFATKGSRVVRVLLSQPDMPLHQKEIVELAGVSKALVSQVVRTLETDAHLVRLPNGTFKVSDPYGLLVEWQDRYCLSDHRIAKGHIYSKGDGPTRTRDLAERFSFLGIQYAFTGLASAWHYAPFSTFRLVSAFLRAPLTPQELEQLGFVAEPRGANVWLLEPLDGSVFWGATHHDGAVFVSTVQTYLDLKEHPERSVEAMAELESRYF